MAGRLSGLKQVALIVSVVAAWWTVPAVAAISLNDLAATPLEVANDGVTSLTLDDELSIAASVSAEDLATGSGDSTDANGYHFAAQAASSSVSSSGTPLSGVKAGIPVGGPRPIAGDVNLDDRVDSIDLNDLTTWFGTTGAIREQGDLNGDQIVDFSDFLILQRHFGNYWVPEPSSVVVWTMIVGFGFLYGYRRRRISTDKSA